MDKEDIKALSGLTKKLESLNKEPNLFERAGIERAEIRHSNILAWLINPKENYGLKDTIIKSIIKYYNNNFNNINSNIITLNNYSEFIIRREYYNIDILAISTKEKTAICIENKIGTGEHDDQLNRYRNILNAQYPDYNIALIYLSPEGEEPSDDNWCAMSYRDIVNIIEEAKNNSTLTIKMQYYIEDYLYIIRRYVLKEELAEEQIINEWINENPRLAELIASHYNKNNSSNISNIIKNWIERKCSNNELLPGKSEKSYIRFTTEEMTNYLPNLINDKNFWNTESSYYYEVEISSEKEVSIKLTLNMYNATDELRNKCTRIITYCNSGKLARKFTTCKRFGCSLNLNDGCDEEEIINFLDNRLADIKQFERDFFTSM